MDNITDDELNGHGLMLIFLANMQQKPINTDSALYKGFIKQLQMRTEHYNTKSQIRFNYNKLSKDDKLAVKDLKLKLYAEYGLIKNINDILSIKDAAIKRYVEKIGLIFDTENMSSNSIFSDVKFTEQDIEEILHLYLVDHYIINLDEAIKFLIDCMYIKYLTKAYKQVKKHYFENNKETMFVELEGLQKELASAQSELQHKTSTIKELQEQIERFEKENRRVKSQLDEELQNRHELNSLREFMFSLDKQEEYIKEPPDFSKLQNIRGLIIGGHENWQKHMKELLPGFKFLHPDMMNFDISILDNIDIAFFYTNYLNHGMYYKVINEARKKNIKIAYISANTNENIVLQQILKAVD